MMLSILDWSLVRAIKSPTGDPLRLAGAASVVALLGFREDAKEEGKDEGRLKLIGGADSIPACNALVSSCAPTGGRSSIDGTAGNGTSCIGACTGC